MERKRSIEDILSESWVISHYMDSRTKPVKQLQQLIVELKDWCDRNLPEQIDWGVALETATENIKQRCIRKSK